MDNALKSRIKDVLDQIERAAQVSKRKGSDITLVCVSKTVSVEQMNEAAAILHEYKREVVFGENYLQEYESKRDTLSPPFVTHCIGPLQSNKVARAVQIFDCIESVHSEKVLRSIDKESKKLNKIMPIFIQVNISNDSNKSGFSVKQLDHIFTDVLPECPSVNLQGLMAITEYYEVVESARKDFQALRIIGDQLAKRYGIIKKQLSLSMGMSADYQIAIEEGATHVRVGSLIFGKRG